MYFFAFEINGIAALLIFLLLLYVFIYLPIKLTVKIIAHAKAKTDRMRKLTANVVVAEYDPPEGLSPAEIGYLLDTKLGDEEVFATIVQLEQRGFVSLDGQKVIEVKQPSKEINDFEKYVLANLKNIIGKNLNKQFLRNVVIDGGVKLNDYLNTKGYLKTYKDRVKGEMIRVLIAMLLLLALFACFLHPKSIHDFTAVAFFTVFFSPLFFLTAVFLQSAYSKIVGEPWMGTPKLKQLWPEIEGYREYIKMVEQDNLKFESENTKGIVKNKVLPYAIALGFNTGWKNKI
jgi:hypothetical protein